MLVVVIVMSQMALELIWNPGRLILFRENIVVVSQMVLEFISNRDCLIVFREIIIVMSKKQSKQFINPSR